MTPIYSVLRDWDATMIDIQAMFLLSMAWVMRMYYAKTSDSILVIDHQLIPNPCPDM